MAKKAAIQIEGLREVQRSIRKAGDEDAKEALKAAHRAAADQVAEVVSPPRDSGLLAASLRTGATVRSGRVAVGRKSVPYAGPIHFGWAARNIEPQPFLYDALDRRSEQVLEAFEAQLELIAANVNQSGV